MNVNRALSTRQRGLTVVELMIALVISLVLLAGVLQIFLSSKQSYRLNENLSRIQETGRFTLDMLAREVRMAGFMPCKIGGNAAVTVKSGTGFDDFLNFFDGGIVGDDGSAISGFDGLPSVGTTDGDRVAGTDAFLILRGSAESYDIINHVENSAQFTLSANRSDLKAGDFAVVCDATHAAVFQMSGPSSNNTSNAVHATGNTVTPGNCTKGLAPPTPPTCLGGDPSFTGNTTNGTGYTFGPGAQLLKFQGTAFFVGISRNGTSRSLYRIRLGSSGGTGGLSNAEELIEHVESLQLLYGLDTDADDRAERYVTADNVTGAYTWNDIVSVRMGILVRTPEEIAQQADARTYNVAGTQIGTATAVSHASDRRLRYVFNTTVKLRNRAIGN